MSKTSLESSLTPERRRILADLHDGLGATLIGLLRHMQSGEVDRSSIERLVQEALREMRIAIDTLWPYEDRLDTALGNLRSRIDAAIRATRTDRRSTTKTLSVTQSEAESELTPREIEVLHALSRGCTYAEIGIRLGVSLGTVTSHIKNSYRKLSVHSSAAAVTRAAELGFLQAPSDAPPAR